jgi:hypothetical protein
MASFFRNKVAKEIGVTPVEVLATAPNSRMTIIGLSLANLTSGIVLIDITLTDDTDVTGYYAKQVLVPPNSSLRVVNGGEKLILSTSNSLSISANVEDAVDAIISYVELI